MDGGSVEVVAEIIGVGNSGPFVQNLGARHGLELDHGLSLCVLRSVSFVHDEPLLAHRQQEQEQEQDSRLDTQLHPRHA